MDSIPRLSNSAISMERADLELMLESLVSLQRVSAEISALLTERLDQVDGDHDAEPPISLPIFLGNILGENLR